MLTQKLRTLGIELPALPGPFGTYVPAKEVTGPSGGLLFVSGQLPMRAGKLLAEGPVPSACSIDAAREAARQCVINALAAVATIGPGAVDRIVGVVRVGCFVQSDHGFAQQPQVANAASELLIELLGDAGRHARAAVGTNALPLNASVEIEFIFQVRTE